MNQFGKIITIFGFVLIVFGLIITYGNNIPLLNKLGNLPGDIVIKKDNFVLYIPIASSLFISFIIYIIFKVFQR